MLQAWRRICDDFPNWRLCLIGGGPDEAELKGLADTLDVQAGVQFVPPIKGLVPVYQHADLYAMSSRAEGPDVIVRNGTDGFLVKQNHTDQLAAKLAELMADEEKRAAFGAQAKLVTERFSLENYLDAYEKLCKDAVK